MYNHRILDIGAGEMAQRVRTLTTLPKVLSSSPSNHMVAHNRLLWDPMPSSGVSEDNYSILIYKIINKSLKSTGFHQI